MRLSSYAAEEEDKGPSLSGKKKGERGGLLLD